MVYVHPFRNKEPLLTLPATLFILDNLANSEDPDEMVHQAYQRGKF